MDTKSCTSSLPCIFYRPSLLDTLQQSNEEVKAYLSQKQGVFFCFTLNTQTTASVKVITIFVLTVQGQEMFVW